MSMNFRARNNRRPFNAPEFSLGDLPKRTLKPMSAVANDQTTGTTTYAVKPTTTTTHHHHHTSTGPCCPPKPDDCGCRRDDSDSHNAAAAASAPAAAAAGGSRLLGGGGSRTPSSASSHSATSVTPNLYLGGQGDAANANLIRKLRIRRILNVAGECDPESAGMPTRVRSSSSCDSSSEREEQEVEEQLQTLHVQIRDHSDENIAIHFAEALAFIHQGIARNEAVLVHCRFGVSRSATMVIAYLMMYGVDQGPGPMRYEQAFDYVKERRPQVSPNLGFVLALHELDEKLDKEKEGKKVNPTWNENLTSNTASSNGNTEEECASPISCAQQHQEQQQNEVVPHHQQLFSPNTIAVSC